MTGARGERQGNELRPGAGRLLEYLVDRFLEKVQFGLPAMRSANVLQELRSVQNGLVVEIEQVEHRPIRQVILAHEILDLSSRTAAKIEDFRAASAGVNPPGFFAQLVGEVFDPVAMGFGGGILEKADVDDLGEERGAFVRIAQDHIHHLVITGIPERLVIGAIDKGRTEDQRVKKAFGKGAVDRTQLFIDFFADVVEA